MNRTINNTYVCMYINRVLTLYLLCMIKVRVSGGLVVCEE